MLCAIEEHFVLLLSRRDDFSSHIQIIDRKLHVMGDVSFNRSAESVELTIKTVKQRVASFINSGYIYFR